MSILIEGMEMPIDDMKNIIILADGRVFQFSGYGNPKPLGTAVPVPEPHGRLIDADKPRGHGSVYGRCLLWSAPKPRVFVLVRRNHR